MYSQLIYPLLAQQEAEAAHDRALTALEWAQATAVGRLFLRLLAGRLPHQPVTVAGLTFPNLLGMAAGFDKDGRVAHGLALLGFGHIEVGTLTPRPQTGNPRPRIFRLRQDEALINRMGFPNGGVAAAVPRLRQLPTPRPFILGVSLGKQKETSLAEATADYKTVMREVYPLADYLAINISSPNTPGLRELQGGDYLGYLLGTLQAESEALAAEHSLPKRPLFLKIAPDLTTAELDQILELALNHAIAGIIATNTTLSRQGLASPLASEQGGLSGRPLAAPSTAVIAHIAQQTNGRLPIIGVGGVQTVADVQAKLSAGASLVQLYTSLVYRGPRLPGRLVRGIAPR
jgi:dihydroorotate dehydrogenase